MNKEQKEVLQSQLNTEKKTIKELKEIYKNALKDCEIKIMQLSARADMNPENLQSIIYQKNYQEVIKAQIEGVLANLQSDSFATVSEYLAKCYQEGYTGVMYDLMNQGIPIITPIDQNAVIKAIQTDSKISTSLYKKMGEDVKSLKDSIRSELSRGIANGSTWNDIAKRLSSHNMDSTIDLFGFKKAYNNSLRIARTEGHRVQIQSAMDAQHEAKKKGADVVKQWDSTLDGKTRDTHRMLDGQIREIDEDFEVGGRKVSAPGMFGDPAEDCNCRCALLQRARWALDEDELKTLEERAEYFGLDKSKDFEDFKDKYLNISNEDIKGADSGGVLSNAQKMNDFVPAKSIKDAEDFISQYVDTSQFGSVGLSYNGIGLDLANEVNKTLYNFFNNFNVGKLGGISAPAKNTKLGKQINAHVGYMPVRNSLVFNRDNSKTIDSFIKGILDDRVAVDDYLKNPEKYDRNKMSKRVLDVLNSASISGRGSVPSNAEEAINHELGHFITQYISSDMDIIEKGMKEYATKISGYACESTSEYIAESFSSYMKGEDLIDPELRKIFDGLRK